MFNPGNLIEPTDAVGIVDLSIEQIEAVNGAMGSTGVHGPMDWSGLQRFSDGFWEGVAIWAG